MIVSIEQHVDWIADCIALSARARLRPHRGRRRRPRTTGSTHVNEVADSTLYPLANSWYMGANIPGKPRVFMPYVGGFDSYKKTCDEVAANGYEGFVMRR